MYGFLHVYGDQSFASLFEFKHFDPESVIIQQGDPALEFFIVAKGLTEIYIEKHVEARVAAAPAAVQLDDVVIVAEGPTTTAAAAAGSNTDTSVTAALTAEEAATTGTSSPASNTTTPAASSSAVDLPRATSIEV